MFETIVFALIFVLVIFCYGAFFAGLFLYLKDKYQEQHAVLRTHPLIGRLRYLFEMIGPEMRQYWFLNDKEARPVDRDTQETIAKAGKYASTVVAFGSKRDFSRGGFYLSNAMFPKNIEELRVDNEASNRTFLYKTINETLFNRKEKRFSSQLSPWFLHPEDRVVIGGHLPKPFVLNGLVGVSAMSYGALSKSAVKALAQGVAISGGSFMNTGEGGISPYHLSKIYHVNENNKPEKAEEFKLYDFIQRRLYQSNFDLIEKFGNDVMTLVESMVKSGFLFVRSTDLIFQVSSGLYGARTPDGNYSEDVFLKNAMLPEVKAIELKLAQGAKVRGGKLPKEKITKEISEIRGVPMGEDINSPNRFPLFHDYEGMFQLIKRWRELTGKPVGIKVVAGDEQSFEELAKQMKETGEGPDFIAIDGGEGGTGATYQAMADTLGLPIFSGLPILHQTLKKHGVRDRVKIIASGMLATSDKMAIALSLGADLIYVARAVMHTVGCISAHKCNTNHCPVGVTSHLPHLESGLIVSEKRFRTANYLMTMRQGLFSLGASCGLDSPVHFSEDHVVFQEHDTSTKKAIRT